MALAVTRGAWCLALVRHFSYGGLPALKPEQRNMDSSTAFYQPLYVMAKPAGALCNLACAYCYYLEKSKLYATSKVRGNVMSDELLEHFTREYIEMHPPGSPVLFTWHGGEPMMRPLSFYQRAVALQQKYAAGRMIDNSFQTNGTLITDDWAAFFSRNHFLVGVSIDGPKELHDAYRRSRGGKPSWVQVMRGIRLLNRHGVEWNAMAVVNDYNAQYPLEFYRFFKEIGCRYIQFTPVVERFLPHADGRNLASASETAGAQLTDFSVTPEAWGEFVCTLFDEWVCHDVAEFYVQLFDSTLANWVGAAPSVCALAETCGHAAAMEHNGDVFVCDHFVFPEYRLGNVYEQSLSQMMQSDALRQFGLDKRDKLTSQCRRCPYLFACHGECPRNRFATSVDGEWGQNYLCAGYRRYFEHVAPYMDFMKYQLQHQQAPARVMQWIAQGRPPYRRSDGA